MSGFDVDKLRSYTACDIADALLANQKMDPAQRTLAGFLCDITRRPSGRIPGEDPLLGPAFTMQFQPREGSDARPSLPQAPSSNIEAKTIWSDEALPGSIVVVQQPEGQRNAAIGGIHMLNLSKKGIEAVVVDGRIRDQGEIQELDIEVCSFMASALLRERSVASRQRYSLNCEL